MKEKKFFIGTLLPAFFFGAIFLIITYLFYYMQPQKMEFTIFFLILTVLLVISQIHFAIAKKDNITFFTFALLPHTIYFQDVLTITFQKKVASGALFLYLKNGQRKMIRLGMYSEEKQKKLITMFNGNMEKQDSFYKDPERLTLWLRSARKQYLICNSIPALILIIAGFATKSVSWSGDYRADWIQSCLGTLLLFFGFGMLISILVQARKRVHVPDSLKTYLAEETADIQDLILQLNGDCRISIANIKGSLSCQGDRYLCFPPNHSVLYLILSGVLFLLALLGGIFALPHFLLAAAGIAFLIWGECFPRCTVFDQQTGTLYWSRMFSLKGIPGKLNMNVKLPAADLIALSLTIRKDLTIQLSCIRKDGVSVPIAIAAQGKAELLFSDTVSLAKQLGGLPVITL